MTNGTTHTSVTIDDLIISQASLAPVTSYADEGES